jgi:hypothetical protein
MSNSLALNSVLANTVSQPNPVPQDSQTDDDRLEQKSEDDTLESDDNIINSNQNPFSKPNIDKLITTQLNEDLWRIMRGGLPCLETSSACLDKLQSRSVTGSPLLRELDSRIQEANDKIDDAKKRNAKTVTLSILTPGLQYLLGVPPQPGQPQTRGFIDNLLGIVKGDIGLINGLISAIGIPFFKASQGANEEANRNAIAISDLQIKTAELQRARAQLADTTREKVAISLVKFDEARTDFQIAQVIASRSVDQFKIFEKRYLTGDSNTEIYLDKLNQLDRTKAQTYSAWGKIRRSLFELKLLVLGVKDAEV